MLSPTDPRRRDPLRARQHLLLLQPQHGCSDELLLVRLALSQDGRQLAGELGWDADLLQDRAELTNQFLFPHIPSVSVRSEDL